jgi:hypothetical protein
VLLRSKEKLSDFFRYSEEPYMEDIAQGLTFLGVELVLIALVLLAMMRTGFAQLESSIGIARDGLPVGKPAPPWSLPDLVGHLRVTPAGDHWQFLIFADHSLASFPNLVAGMNHLAATVQELEILVLSRESRDLCEATVRALNLHVPIVQVDQEFYNRFRVRVMPFATLLDPRGTVRWVSLVNIEEQLSHAWRTIRAMTDEGGFSEEVSR